MVGSLRDLFNYADVIRIRERLTASLKPIFLYGLINCCRAVS